MKQQSLVKALGILFALLLSLPVAAQGVIVHKKDGTKVRYSYEVLDRIETYNYDEEIPGDTGEYTANGVSFSMVMVEGGTFTMGAQSTSAGSGNYDSDAYSDESPVHQVTVGDFYMGKYEVTQELWSAVMGSNPSVFTGTNLPVEAVSWEDCQTFITKLNGLAGKTFRLPTEAEWEYAARGGNKSQGYKYSGGDSIGDVAWNYSNSSATTHEVGTKTPNELGLYDMSGNVWEWCSDWHGSYSSSSQTDPAGPSTGSSRVLRGGSWSEHAGYCRVSYRSCHTPSTRYGDLGLRLVCVP